MHRRRRRRARSPPTAGFVAAGSGSASVASGEHTAGSGGRQPRMAAMHTSAEIREGFLSFFEENGHLRRPSASLVPRSDDRSTLLTTAGMQPQMPFLLISAK